MTLKSEFHFCGLFSWLCGLMHLLIHSLVHTSTARFHLCPHTGLTSGCRGGTASALGWVRAPDSGSALRGRGGGRGRGLLWPQAMVPGLSYLGNSCRGGTDVKGVSPPPHCGTRLAGQRASCVVVVERAKLLPPTP